MLNQQHTSEFMAVDYALSLNIGSNQLIVTRSWDTASSLKAHLCAERTNRKWRPSDFGWCRISPVIYFKILNFVFSSPPSCLCQDALQKLSEECKEDHRSAVCDQKEVLSPHLGEQEQLAVRAG